MSRTAALLLVLALTAGAAPVLRLNQTVVGPLSTASGASPAPRSIEAFNAGDGSLNLMVTSSEPWLSAAPGAPIACSDRPGQRCIPIQINFATNGLTKGTHTGTLTVADPGAWDAPQRVTVTVQAGGAVPDQVNFYLPPNGSDSRTFTTAAPVNANAATATGGNWLSVVLDGVGTFRFNVPYRITARAEGQAAGTYTGTVTTSGSPLPEENKTVNVQMVVTPQPIVVPTATELNLRLAQNIPASDSFVVLQNRGSGTFTPGDVTATTTAGGDWLTVTRQDSLLTAKVDTNNLAPGRYTGTITAKSNAANGDVVIPVRLEVVAQAPPVVAGQGVVNNATFRLGDPVALGGIAALFGEQLHFGPPVQASAVPLPTKLGETRVLVNGRAAPLYYVSYNQINFQIPYEITAGQAVVQVERNGQIGNTATVDVAPSAPRILRLGVGEYGVIVNQDGSFPMPATPGFNSHPAKAGDVLVIYAIGLGQTNPVVATGTGAPGAEPLARVDPLPKVYIGGQLFRVEAHPVFIGQTPNFVGLYQLNVFVPPNVQPGTTVPVFIEQNNMVSNIVNIAIQ